MATTTGVTATQLVCFICITLDKRNEEHQFQVTVQPSPVFMVPHHAICLHFPASPKDCCQNSVQILCFHVPFPVHFLLIIVIVPIIHALLVITGKQVPSLSGSFLPIAASPPGGPKSIVQ